MAELKTKPNSHALMNKLGKYKTGKSCLYIKSLEDVDFLTLRELIERSAAHVAKSEVQ